MPLKFSTFPNPLTIPIQNGTAAFDPTTLFIAAKEFAALGCDLTVHHKIQGNTAPALTQLATIEFNSNKGSITVTIDTEHMSWSSKGEAEKGKFTSYGNTEIVSVELGRQRIKLLPHGITTRLDMELSDGSPIHLWVMETAPFHRVDDPKNPTISAIELFDRAHESQQQWTQIDDSEIATIAIPRTEAKYSAMNSAVSSPQGPITTNQDIDFRVDHTGARAKAVTTILYTGLSMPLPTRKEFGSDNPVMMWLSEPDNEDANDLPFCIVYTTASSWILASE